MEKDANTETLEEFWEILDFFHHRFACDAEQFVMHACFRWKLFFDDLTRTVFTGTFHGLQLLCVYCYEIKNKNARLSTFWNFSISAVVIIFLFRFWRVSGAFWARFSTVFRCATFFTLWDPSISRVRIKTSWWIWHCLVKKCGGIEISAWIGEWNPNNNLKRKCVKNDYDEEK